MEHTEITLPVTISILQNAYRTQNQNQNIVITYFFNEYEENMLNEIINSKMYIFKSMNDLCLYMASDKSPISKHFEFIGIWVDVPPKYPGDIFMTKDTIFVINKYSPYLVGINMEYGPYFMFGSKEQALEFEKCASATVYKLVKPLTV